jgi:TusE/DsrC/DsvC family sulfur relay protein
MALEVNGKSIELDDNGNLVNTADWNEDVAKALAAADDIELTEDHWEVIKYLREEYFDNGGNQPMERIILKDMGKRLGKKVSSKDMYRLFPKAPSKQGNRIAGLPFVQRKGGY